MTPVLMQAKLKQLEKRIEQLENQANASQSKVKNTKAVKVSTE